MTQGGRPAATQLPLVPGPILQSRGLPHCIHLSCGRGSSLARLAVFWEPPSAALALVLPLPSCTTAPLLSMALVRFHGSCLAFVGALLPFWVVDLLVGCFPVFVGGTLPLRGSLPAVLWDLPCLCGCRLGSVSACTACVHPGHQRSVYPYTSTHTPVPACMQPSLARSASPAGPAQRATQRPPSRTSPPGWSGGCGRPSSSWCASHSVCMCARTCVYVCVCVCAYLCACCV